MVSLASPSLCESDGRNDLNVLCNICTIWMYDLLFCDFVHYKYTQKIKKKQEI